MSLHCATGSYMVIPVRKTAEQKAAALYLSPPEIACELGIAHQKVLAWIESGELPAVDISTRRNKRRRFKVRRSDFDAFLANRSAKPRTVAHRRKTAAHVAQPGDKRYV